MVLKILRNCGIITKYKYRCTKQLFNRGYGG